MFLVIVIFFAFTLAVWASTTMYHTQCLIQTVVTMRTAFDRQAKVDGIITYAIQRYSQDAVLRSQIAQKKRMTISSVLYGPIAHQIITFEQDSADKVHMYIQLYENNQEVAQQYITCSVEISDKHICVRRM